MQFAFHLLDDTIRMLANMQTLPEEYCDHQLSGNWRGFRECHISSDWILIYKVEKNILVLTLSRTGTRSDLFNN